VFLAHWLTRTLNIYVYINGKKNLPLVKELKGERNEWYI